MLPPHPPSDAGPSFPLGWDEEACVSSVIPAKAGIQKLPLNMLLTQYWILSFRRNDEEGLSLDFREISHCQRRLADLVQQLQPVFTEVFRYIALRDIDRDVNEESVDRRAELG